MCVFEELQFSSSAVSEHVAFISLASLGQKNNSSASERNTGSVCVCVCVRVEEQLVSV